MKRDSVVLINGKSCPLNEAISANFIVNGVYKLIKKKYPQWNSESYISRNELKEFRKDYFENLIKKEKGNTHQFDKEVLNSIISHESTVKKIMSQREPNHFSQRMADKFAFFAGSWHFIISFFVLLFLWILINTIGLFYFKIDPYPFVFLNLILSCVAAIQAPIIIMSQNRKEIKDRKRQQDDYKINLRSELEIRLLQEKIDHLIESQWAYLLEMKRLESESLKKK